jgi:hypothetical protein
MQEVHSSRVWFGLNSSWKGQINVCPKVNRYEDIAILSCWRNSLELMDSATTFRVYITQTIAVATLPNEEYANIHYS